MAAVTGGRRGVAAATEYYWPLTAVFPDLPEAVAAPIGRSVAESRSEGTPPYLCLGVAAVRAVVHR